MSWYQLEYLGGKHYRLHLRRWHPGLWFEVYRTIRSCGTGIFASVFFTIRAVISITRRKK